METLSSILSFASVVSVIFSIVVVVIFIKLAGNVAQIKKHITDEDDALLIQEYLIAKQIGDKQRVYEAILRKYYRDMGKSTYNHERIQIHRQLFGKYNAEVVTMGYNFPEEPSKL